MAYVWNTPTSQNILQGLQGFIPSSVQTPSVATPNPIEAPVGYSPATNFSLGMNGYAQGTAPFQYNAGTSPTFTGLQDVQGLSNNAFAGNLNTGVPGYGLTYGMDNTGETFQPVDWMGDTNTTPESPGFFSWDRFLGTKDKAGFGPVAFQGLQAAGSVYSAIQGARAAKNLLNFQKKAYRQNYNQQAQTLNTAMQDRQASRRSSSNQYQDVGSYMKQHELKSI